MTAQQALLALGTLILAGCGVGLVWIHGTNPLLKGLNWMGTALATGGFATALLLGSQAIPALGPAADFCILVAFACSYRADRYLLGLEARQEVVSASLLSVQALACGLQWFHFWGPRGGIAVTTALVAVQLEMTARLIQGNTCADARLAAQFTVRFMHLMTLGNLTRGAYAVTGWFTGSHAAELLDLITYGFFIGAAIALAFAFFWRTTTKLSLDLEHMASTDPLTRVYNRRVFLNWCETEQRKSIGTDMPFSVLMLDFDHFKKINDTFGHHVGDTVLVAAVERIQDSIRGIDILCRWGGEEFAVLLPNASEEATVIVAERIRANIRALKSADRRFSDTNFDTIQLTASIGTATYLGGPDHFERMLQRADAALYEAKRAGRNKVMLSACSDSGWTFATPELVLGGS